MMIYIARDGGQLGPYSLEEAQKLVGSGTITVSDFAWYEGLGNWIPLTEVPGFKVPANVPLPPAKRPVLVWIICIFYFICTPLSLFTLVLIHLMATGAIPVHEAQRHYFQSQGYFDYGLIIVNAALCFAWAILLFLLKKASLYLYIGLLILGVLVLIYNIVAKDWLSVVQVEGLIGAAVGWIINFAVLYYNWYLYKKDTLR